MRRKPLVILLLVMLGLAFVVTIAGCGKIKKIIQSSGPSGPGQHIDIGYGWDQGIDGGWREDLATSINSGLALDKANVDPYINQMTAGNKILYQYNFSPVEQEQKGLIGLAMKSSIKIIELKLPTIDIPVYVYDRTMGVFAIPMLGVVCTDKSDLDAGLGYARFEYEIPDSAGDLLVFVAEDALVLSRSR